MVSMTESSQAQVKDKYAQLKLAKRVYLFEEGYDAFAGNRDAMKDLLGGKGAGLAEMTHSCVNVPPGLTILTSCCRSII